MEKVLDFAKSCKDSLLSLESKFSCECEFYRNCPENILLSGNVKLNENLDCFLSIEIENAPDSVNFNVCEISSNLVSQNEDPVVIFTELVMKRKASDCKIELRDLCEITLNEMIKRIKAWITIKRTEQKISNKASQKVEKDTNVDQKVELLIC